MAMPVIKIQVSDPGPSVPSCLLMEVIYLLALLVTTIYIDQNLKRNSTIFRKSSFSGKKVDLLNVIIISYSNHSYWVSLLHPFYRSQQSDVCHVPVNLLCKL